jgi:hypothetical protein
VTPGASATKKATKSGTSAPKEGKKKQGKLTPTQQLLQGVYQTLRGEVSSYYSENI